MLIYLNAGTRLYGESPVHAHERRAVEFQAVLSGTCFPTGHAAPRQASPCLWTHGPDHSHGWSDRPGGKSEILVFHFQGVAAVLLEVLRERGPLCRSLDASGVFRLRALHAELAPHAREMTRRSPLWFEKCRAELCLLALADLPDQRPESGERWAAWKVEQALAWYRERMSVAPTVAAVAAASHVSPAHLRRLFQRVRGESPHAAFHHERMRASHALVAAGDLPLARIAEQLGFSEPSAFSRAYRDAHGHAPRSARTGA
jgi:AraC family transcriptional regulator